MQEKMDGDTIKEELKLQSEGTLQIEEFTKFSLKDSEGEFAKLPDYDEILKDLRPDTFNLSYEELDKGKEMEAYLRMLQSKKIIKEYDLNFEFKEITVEEIVKLSEQSLDILLDDESGEAFYLNEANKKIFLNFDFDDDTFHRKSLSAVLPEVTFDVLQNGDIDKAKEAESIYKVIVMNKIFLGLYSRLIYQTMDGYDFATLSPKEGSNDFREILKIMLEESSAVARVIVSACNLKLVDYKTKKDMKLLKRISMEEDRELRNLKLRILSLRNSYVAKIDAETTKARREVKREELRREENTLIQESKVSILYRIFDLNTESIPTKSRIEITRLAKELSYAMKEKFNIKGKDSLILRVANKFKKRGFREFLIEKKSSLFEDYKSGKDIDLHPKS